MCARRHVCEPTTPPRAHGNAPMPAPPRTPSPHPAPTPAVALHVCRRHQRPSRPLPPHLDCLCVRTRGVPCVRGVTCVSPPRLPAHMAMHPCPHPHAPPPPTLHLPQLFLCMYAVASNARPGPCHPILTACVCAPGVRRVCAASSASAHHASPRTWQCTHARTPTHPLPPPCTYPSCCSACMPSPATPVPAPATPS